MTPSASWSGYQLGGSDQRLPDRLVEERFARILIVCTCEDLAGYVFRTTVAMARARCRHLQLEVVA